MMEQKEFSYQNTRVCYYAGGQGQAVVLLHGFGEDSAIWKNQVEVLSAHYRLIVPDIPGSGLSGPLHNSPSIEDFADVVKALLDEEKTTSCAILGHSMGGYIALAFAQKYPGCLSGLGLVHSTAFADSDKKKIARAKSIDFIRVNGGYAFLKTTIPGLFSNAFASTDAPAIAQLVEKAAAFSATVLIDYYRAMILRPDRSALLATAAIPVLFIAGIHDSAVPFEQSLKQLHLPGQAHIHLLRHSAHMGMLEEPAVTNAAITVFLAAIFH
jgi:pimeloyl-ACP methyl ester carboxylesterase